MPCHPTHVFGVYVNPLRMSHQRDDSIFSPNCENKMLTVHYCAGVTHQLTLPLDDLFGLWFTINSPNFFTDDPGHDPGYNEAVDHANVFQYVAFQMMFLFGFLYIVICSQQRRRFSSISSALHRHLLARHRARIYPPIIVYLNEKDRIAKGVLSSETSMAVT